VNPLGRKTEGFCQGDEVRVPEFTTDFAPPKVGLLIARDIAAFTEKGYSTSSIKYIADLLGMRGAAHITFRRRRPHSPLFAKPASPPSSPI